MGGAGRAGGDTSSFFLLLLLLLLSGWAVHEGHGWRAKQQYVYRLEGRTVAGFLTLDTRGVGVHYLAAVRLQGVSDTTLLLKVDDAKYTSVQEDMPDSWWRRVEQPGDHWQQLPLTDTTFVIKHVDGVVKSVSYSPQLAEWEVNLVQGVVGQLQASLAGGARLFPGADPAGAHANRKRTATTSIYKVMEGGVAGRCEVLYEVSKVSRAYAILGSDWPNNTDLCGGRSLLEVTKTTNYSNCERTAEYHAGLPSSAAGCSAGSSVCGDFWQRVFVTRMRGCGDRKEFTVLDSVGTSRQIANLHLHEESGAAINSYLNLSLVSMHPVESFFTTVSRPSTQKDLAYLYRPQELEEGERRSRRYAESAGRRSRAKQHHQVQRGGGGVVRPDATSAEDDDEEEPWGSGEAAPLPPPDARNPHQVPYGTTTLWAPFLARGAKDLRRLLLELATDLDEPRQLQQTLGLEKLDTALAICRSMTRSQLQAAVGDMLSGSAEYPDTIRKLAMDFVAICGTHPAFRLIKEMIESEAVSKDSAADVIATVPQHISAPTVALLDDFSELMTSPAVKKHQQLLVSTVLAFSNLVRAACANHQLRRSAYTTEVFRADVCSPRAAERMLRQLVSVAKRNPSLQTVMLTALGNTALPGALPLISSVAASDSSAYVRSVAVFAMRHHVLVQPRATLPLLLAEFQRPENPLAVRMAAVALLWHASPPLAVWQRVAVSTWYEKDPALVAFIASSLDSFANTDNPGWEQMKKNAQAARKLARPTPVGPERAYNLLWNNACEKLNGMVMQQLEWIYNFKSSTLYYHSGSRLGNLPWFNFEVEVNVASPDDLMASLRELLSPAEDVAAARPPLEDLPRSISDIARSVNMALKAAPSLETAFRVKTSHLTERMFAFGKKLPVELAKAGRGLLEHLRHGKPFHFQKVNVRQVAMRTTTETGFPVSFKLSVPCAVRMSGEAKVSAGGNHLAVDVSAFYARHLVSELEVYTAWDRTVHVAGSHGYSIAVPPALRVNARVDGAASLVQLEVKPSPRVPGGGAFHHSSMPYLAQRGAQETSLSRRQPIACGNRPRKIEYRNRKVVFRYEADDPRSWMDLYENSVSVAGFLTFPDLRAMSVDVKLAEMPPVVATFGLGTAAVKNGEVMIRRAPSEGQEWPMDILHGEADLEVMMRDMGEEDLDAEASTTPPPPPESSAEGRDELWPPPDAIASPTLDSEEATAELYGYRSSSSSSHEAEDECKEEDQDWAMEQGHFVSARGLEPHWSIVDGSRYLLQESLQDFRDGRSFVVSANIAVNTLAPRNYSAFLVRATRPSGLVRTVGLFVKDLTSDWQVSFGSDTHDSILPSFSLDEEIVSNLSSVIYSDLQLRANDTVYALSFSGRASHGEGKAAALAASWEEEGCRVEDCSGEPMFNDKCRKLLQRASSYDLLKATLRYNEQVSAMLPDELPWQDDVKDQLSQYMDDERRTSRSGYELSVVGLVSSSGEEMDLVVNMPGSSRLYTDLPMPFTPPPTTTSALLPPPTCILGKNRIATYDGVEFEYGINNCWHVVTMDCSGKNKMAVLARRKEEAIEVEVNADNYKVVALSAGPWATVNGAPEHLDEGNSTQVYDERGDPFAELSLGPDRALRVDLLAYGLRLVYSESAVQLQSSWPLDGRVCGLCGDQDGERADEWTGPTGQALSSADALGRAFMLRDSQCEPAAPPPPMSPDQC